MVVLLVLVETRDPDDNQSRVPLDTVVVAVFVRFVLFVWYCTVPCTRTQYYIKTRKQNGIFRINTRKVVLIIRVKREKSERNNATAIVHVANLFFASRDNNHFCLIRTDK